MSIHPRDVMAFVGGIALQQYGTLAMRRAPAYRGGEDASYTFARTGEGQQLNRAGLLVLSDENVPRLHWTNLLSSGVFDTPALLLEDARTNAWTYSQDLGNAVWSTVNANKTTNQTTAPDGTTTGDLLHPSATTADHYITRNAPALTDNTKSTVSIHAKREDQHWICIGTIDKSGAERKTWVNLTYGTLGTKDNGHAVWIDPHYNVNPTAGEGWWRIYVTFDAASGGTTPSVRFYVCDEDAATSYLGVVNEGIYLWGIQFETDKACGSSYMKTTTSTATRNAETFTLPLYAEPQAVQAYLRFRERGSAWCESVNANVFTWGDLTDRFQVYSNGSSGYRSYHYSGGGSVSTSALTRPDPGDLVEFLATLNADGSVGAIQSINSATSTTTSDSAAKTLPSAWSDQLIQLNDAGGSNRGYVGLIAAIMTRGVGRSLDDFRALITQASSYGQQAGGGG